MAGNKNNKKGEGIYFSVFLSVPQIGGNSIGNTKL
jgi:hypothetical protein